jgi:2,4-dienoyl-CoA reductase-like NADH-dependent reductase (Old Yellow Enzyme family)
MSTRIRFEKLLEPGRIGSVKTRNRIIKTGAGMLMWHEDDLHVNQRVKAYYESIARGGVGLLVVETATIDYPLGARWRERYRIDDDKYIKGLKQLASFGEFGAKIRQIANETNKKYPYKPTQQ